MAWISNNYVAKSTKMYSHFFKNIPENFELQTVSWNAETIFIETKVLLTNLTASYKKVTCIQEQLHMFLFKGQFFV